MRVKGKLTLCSDWGCDHGREVYLIVNPSLNAMFITLPIYWSSINDSKGMSEMTCWKMPRAPSQGHAWTINVRHQTVDNTGTRLMFPFTPEVSLWGRKRFTKEMHPGESHIHLVMPTCLTMTSTLACAKRARVGQLTLMQTLVLWLLALQVLPFVSSHFAQAASAASLGTLINTLYICTYFYFNC